MPRVGQNPAKFVSSVLRPAPITVALLSYIPFLAGYYEQSLEVFKLELKSILENTVRPYDLMVFDNGSCPPVIAHLRELKEKGLIQFLILSSKNVGKVGAWNMIFKAAPGEYIAYADSDILFFPGWLEAHLKVFDAYPNVGTVTGLPRRRRITFSENTLENVKTNPEIQIKIGKFIPTPWIEDHARSVGKLDDLEKDLQLDDYWVQCKGVPAYITAQHFQFMIRKETVTPMLPFKYERPMGEDVAKFDLAVDGSGYLRLATAERVVLHMGNRLDEEWIKRVGDAVKNDVRGETQIRSHLSIFQKIIRWSPIRWLLLGIYHRIFRIYYSN